jgi:hypothetical protein
MQCDACISLCFVNTGCRLVGLGIFSHRLDLKILFRPSPPPLPSPSRSATPFYFPSLLRLHLFWRSPSRDRPPSFASLRRPSRRPSPIILVDLGSAGGEIASRAGSPSTAGRERHLPHSLAESQSRNGPRACSAAATRKLVKARRPGWKTGNLGSSLLPSLAFSLSVFVRDLAQTLDRAIACFYRELTFFFASFHFYRFQVSRSGF